VVFAAGVRAHYTWLVVVGILNSVVGVYYYLNVMKYVYLFRMEHKDEDRHPIAVSSPQVIALLVLAGAVVLIGTVFAPWFGFANAAGANLF
jgi:NADH-quinone oxidoreductase subunit N